MKAEKEENEINESGRRREIYEECEVYIDDYILRLMSCYRGVT